MNRVGSAAEALRSMAAMWGALALAAWAEAEAEAEAPLRTPRPFMARAAHNPGRPRLVRRGGFLNEPLSGQEGL